AREPARALHPYPTEDERHTRLERMRIDAETDPELPLAGHRPPLSIAPPGEGLWDVHPPPTADPTRGVRTGPRRNRIDSAPTFPQPDLVIRAAPGAPCGPRRRSRSRSLSHVRARPRGRGRGRRRPARAHPRQG